MNEPRFSTCQWIVRQGEQVGIEARANERLVDIVKKVERRELKQDPRTGRGLRPRQSRGRRVLTFLRSSPSIRKIERRGQSSRGQSPRSSAFVDRAERDDPS